MVNEALLAELYVIRGLIVGRRGRWVSALVMEWLFVVFHVIEMSARRSVFQDGAWMIAMRRLRSDMCQTSGSAPACT